MSVAQNVSWSKTNEGISTYLDVQKNPTPCSYVENILYLDQTINEANKNLRLQIGGAYRSVRVSRAAPQSSQ